MFSSKLEVDKHVQKCLMKTNSETERNLRCYSFAKLYYSVGAYDDARRYINSYIGSKQSAEAYHFLGQILTNMSRKVEALEAFEASLRLDPKQNKVALRVCELLCDDEVPIEGKNTEKYCEMAQNVDPTNPIVFQLKEKILKASNADTGSLSKLLAKELDVRPDDVNLRIRYITNLLQQRKTDEAYQHIVDIESKPNTSLHTNVKWYETAVHVMKQYKIQNPDENNWETWVYHTIVYDKFIALCLDNKHSDFYYGKVDTEFMENLFNYDQHLFKCQNALENCTNKCLSAAFLRHFGAQLGFHLALALLRLTKHRLPDPSDSDYYRMMLPLLLLHAYNTEPINLQDVWVKFISDDLRHIVTKWDTQASFRRSQSGHVLTALLATYPNSLKYLQQSPETWKVRLFRFLFPVKDQNSMHASYFYTHIQTTEDILKAPERVALRLYDELSQMQYPHSLHHYVWIYRNNRFGDIKLQSFSNLPFSIKNLRNSSPETINILDIQTFIYCTMLCANANLDINCHSYLDKHKIPLPAALLCLLSTHVQNKFLLAAYKISQCDQHANTGELRQILIKGIQVVRCIDQHGLDVQLLVDVANAFTRLVSPAEMHEVENAVTYTQCEREFFEDRAELFWTQALPLLEKLKVRQTISYPTNRLFALNKPKQFSLTEITHNIEQAQLFIGQRLAARKEFENALHLFEQCSDPFAAFHRAQIYKRMSDETNISTQTKLALLTKARDSLYLSLDRLRDPRTDHKHPLNHQLTPEIEIVESKLSELTLDAHENSSFIMNGSSTNFGPKLIDDEIHTLLEAKNQPLYSTPTRQTFSLSNFSALPSNECKPSPERLDAQIRYLSANQETTLGRILEQNKSILHAQSKMEHTLTDLQQSVVELQNGPRTPSHSHILQDTLSILRHLTDSVADLKKEMSELKKDMNKGNQITEEDIYNLTNDYTTNDYNLPTAPASVANFYNATTVNYQRSQTSSAPVPPILPYPITAYPGLYATPTNALPPPNHQIPYAAAVAAAAAALGAAPLQPCFPALTDTTTSLTFALPTTTSAISTSSLIQLLTQSSAKISPAKLTTTSISSLPINVVITNSDPLPVMTSTVQPPLSVTIPPEHINRSSAATAKNVTSTPHNYQIPLKTTPIVTPPSFAPTPPAFIPSSLAHGQSRDDLEDDILETSATEIDPMPDFKPIIPLPDKVVIKTGEEDENVLFAEHAQLYRFQESWRERGSGKLKILQNKSAAQKIRILMRRDQVFKICANHLITTDMRLDYKQNSNRSFVWVANDFSEEEPQLQTFCVRFKTAELADRFLQSFQSAQNIIRQLQNDSSINTSESTPVTPASTTTITVSTPMKFGGFSFAEKPKINLSTDKKIEPAISTSTTSTSSPFANFSFKALSESPFALTPAKDSSNTGGVFAFGSLSKATTMATSTSNSSISSWGGAFQPKLGSWECKTCYVRNDAETQQCVTCDSPKDGTIVKKQEPATRPKFGASAWGNAFQPKVGSWECKMCYVRNDAEVQQCVTCGSSIDGTVAKKQEPIAQTKFGTSTWGSAFQPKVGSWECKTCYIRNDGDTQHCASCSTPKDDTVPKKAQSENTSVIKLGTPTNQFTFGIKPSTSESLAPVLGTNSPFTFRIGSASGSSTTPSTSTPFTFGTPTFSFMTPKTTAPSIFTTTKSPVTSKQKEEAVQRTDSNTDDDEEIAEEENTTYFKPVIPLPDKIDVKTGEEDEDTLYCQRAKLYRYSEGEWKERGIGDVKILRNQQTGKLRVVMRRDKVLKICLNHALTSNIEYILKDNNDDKTWLFSALDYSEGKLETEKFCLRFKNSEFAQEFKKATLNAIQSITDKTYTGDLTGELSTLSVVDKTETDVDNDDSDDLKIVSETTVTQEEEREALSLQLPPKFLAYRQLKDCDCDQCKRDDAYYATQTPNTHAPICTEIDVNDGNKTVTQKNDTGGGIILKPAVFSWQTPATETGAISKTGPFFGSFSKGSVPTSENNTTSSLPTTNVATATVTPSNIPTTFSFASFMTQAKTNITTAATNSSLFASTTNFTPLGAANSSDTKSAGSNSSIFGMKPTFGALGTTPTVTTSLFGKSQQVPKPFSTVSTEGIVSTDDASGASFNAKPPVIKSSIFGMQPTFASFGNTNATTTSLFGNVLQGSAQFSNIFTDNSTSAVASTDSANGTNGAKSVSHTDATGNANETGGVMLPLKFGEEMSFAYLASKVAENNKTGLGTNSTDNANKKDNIDKDKSDEVSTTTSKEESKKWINPFASIGAGKPVFANAPKLKSNEETENGDAADADNNDENEEADNSTEPYDPHYAPIVPLPQLIEVSTGEEDEKVLVRGRCKLYRFDQDSKEWKERGVGEIKILHHPTKETYRLLMRREQVFKVVLNMLLTPDLDMQPMKNQTKALVWAGYNHTDEGSMVEKLAVRFNTPELCQSVLDKVNDVIKKIENRKINEEHISTPPPALELPQSAQNDSPTSQQQIQDQENNDYDENDDDYDDENDDDENDDDDDRGIMFSGNCTLEYLDKSTNNWLLQSNNAYLEIYYDCDYVLSKMTIRGEDDVIINHTTIEPELNMIQEGCTCRWNIWDILDGNVFEKTFRAVFLTASDAENCFEAFKEGKMYAEQGTSPHVDDWGHIGEKRDDNA